MTKLSLSYLIGEQAEAEEEALCVSLALKCSLKSSLHLDKDRERA